MTTAVIDEFSDLFERVYGKLRSLAERHFRGRTLSVTLQPTALVHEVYLRLACMDVSSFQDREHFLAVATRAMRQVLVDQARRRKALKRGGDCTRVSLTGVAAMPGTTGRDAAIDILEIDDLLTRLAHLSPRQSRVVELRIFAGLKVVEIASVLGVSTRTVEKDWRKARAWMRVEHSRGQAP